jgi:hypothetical protein
MPSAIGEIEPRAFLRQVGRRQVDGDAPLRPVEVSVQQAERTRSRLSRTAASGRPTIVRAGQAARQMHLDVHPRRFDPERRSRMHDGEAHAALPRRVTGQRPWVLWRAVGYGMSLIAGSLERDPSEALSGTGCAWRIPDSSCEDSQPTIEKNAARGGVEGTRAAESVPPVAPGEADAAR